MSNYHILDIDEAGECVSCIFHIPVEKTERSALVAKQGGASEITSNVKDIPEEDSLKLKDGSMCEVNKQVRFSSLGLTTEQQLAEIKTAYVNEKTKTAEGLKKTLSLYGQIGDEK